MRRSGHASHMVKSHKVQSVKSCESARVSAETVSGGSVVAVDVDGKDGIVAGKVGCAQRGRGLKCVRIVSPNPETREGTLLPFVTRRGQPVDHGQRVGIARRRCAPRSPERLVDLLLVVVCVEKCGMSLMSITCRGCGGGARWSCSGTMGPAACRRRASRCPHLSRQSCRGVSWKPAPESTTSSTTTAMHLPTCFHLGFFFWGVGGRRR